MNVRNYLGCAALILSALFPIYSVGAAFVDPLDEAARPSELASQTLMLSLDKAGTRLVAVGQRGHIVYSDDRGQSWQQASVPVSSDLTSVRFVNATKGWAVGHDGVILNSQDGGKTWTKQLDGRQANALMVEDLQKSVAAGGDVEHLQRLLDEAVASQEAGPDKPFLGVWFTDEQRGYAVGAYNLIFQTEDGGTHWQPWFDRTENPNFLHLNTIIGVGDQIYIAGERGLFLRLESDSQRFVALPTPYTGSFFSLAAPEGGLLALGMRGNAYRTTDNGQSWKAVETGVNSGLSGATTLTDGRLIVVSQGGQVVISNDKGRTFKVLENIRPMSFAAVSQAGANSIAVAGLQGVRVEPLSE